MAEGGAAPPSCASSSSSSLKGLREQMGESGQGGVPGGGVRGVRRPKGAAGAGCPPPPAAPLDVRPRPGAGKGHREWRPPGLAGPSPALRPVRAFPQLRAVIAGFRARDLPQLAGSSRGGCGEAALHEPPVFHRFSDLSVSVVALAF